MFLKKTTGIRYKTASELNCLITFQQATGAEADGTLNGFVDVWTTHASILMWRGREETEPQQRNATSTFKVVVRYNKYFTPTADMVISYHGDIYNIETVSDVDGQRVQLELWCWTENQT